MCLGVFYLGTIRRTPVAAGLAAWTPCEGQARHCTPPPLTAGDVVVDEVVVDDEIVGELVMIRVGVWCMEGGSCWGYG